MRMALGCRALRTGPDFVLRPPQFRELRCAQRSFTCGEELVELRGRDVGAAQHRVRLTAMMNLMLKEMQQQPVHSLALDTIFAVDLNEAIEIGVAESIDDSDQSPVHVSLRVR